MFTNDNVLYEFRGPWGLPVQIGQSLVFLIVMLFGLSGAMGSISVHTLIVVAMLLGSILLHELGHAWACLVQGIPVRRVLLYGGGGLCERARSASPSEQELIVAMGPIVNAVLWALSSLLSEWLWTQGSADMAYYLGLFARINGALALFNLIPVQPLDGGKLFHLGLLRVLSATLANRVAGGLGLIFALVWWPAMILLYLTTGWLLLFAPSVREHLAMLRGRFLA